MKYKNVFKHLLFVVCVVVLHVACHPKASTITILHTNDTHSQVEPIEKGKRDGNFAGYARRMGFIQQERIVSPELILLDAGDFSQGTPYFNFYHGRVEVDALNQMGYDAVTLGNHEFDNGVDTLAAVLKDAQFAVLSANYDVRNTPLEGIVQPYTILTRAGVRVGILGVGVDPTGLIAERNFAPVRYLDPIASVQHVASELKNRYHCDVIICISHLGTEHANAQRVSDVQLAKATRYIDVIVGGHTHQIVTNRYEQNLDGKDVLLTQMGKSGARIGKISLKIGE